MNIQHIGIAEIKGTSENPYAVVDTQHGQPYRAFVVSDKETCPVTLDELKSMDGAAESHLFVTPICTNTGKILRDAQHYYVLTAALNLYKLKRERRA